MSALRIAGITHDTGVNGPGRRALLHLQGCTLACPGCFNPQTHPAEGGDLAEVRSLITELLERAPDGVSISGGEPFQQVAGLTALLNGLRKAGADSILVFTGYTLDELSDIDGADAALSCIDVLVAGRYDAKQPIQDVPLLSSENQRLHLLTARHGAQDIDLAGGNVEITIGVEGNVRVTGFPPAGMRRAIRALE